MKSGMNLKGLLYLILFICNGNKAYRDHVLQIQNQRRKIVWKQLKAQQLA
jgi:hypothetical protein